MTLDDLAKAMTLVANARPEDVQRLEMAKAAEGSPEPEPDDLYDFIWGP